MFKTTSLLKEHFGLLLVRLEIFLVVLAQVSFPSVLISSPSLETEILI